MPGWSDKLSDQEVAAVATYIRQAWSNRAGPVTPKMVAALKGK
jgi:mono/diheme cytochrome c family protein